MPAFQEANRLYFPAESRSQILASINLAAANAVWIATDTTATNAIMNYHLLLRGIASIAYDGGPNFYQQPAAILDDFKDILKLGTWYHEVVFEPILTMRAQHRAQANVAAPTPRDLWFQEHWNDMGAVLLSIQSSVYGGLNTPAAQAFRAEVQTWLVPGAGLVPNIPGLGFMELIARIRAQTVASVGDLIGRLMNMEFTVVQRGFWGRASMGLPVVVFLCGGANTAASLYVATTSQDNWNGYNLVSNRAHQNRFANRIGSPPISTAPANFNVPNLSTAVFNQYNFDTPQVQNPATTYAQVRALRDSLIQRWQNPAGAASPGAPPFPAVPRCANHAVEIATPVECPSFESKARCLRCQAMFEYNVAWDADTVSEERGWRSSKAPLGNICNPYYVCAETIAHFYCNEAKGAAANH